MSCAVRGAEADVAYGHFLDFVVHYYTEGHCIHRIKEYTFISNYLIMF